MDNIAFKTLARRISIVENEVAGYQDILKTLPTLPIQQRVIGVTGPPGAGKSTLIDSIIALLTANGQTVGILAVDPSSPFTSGSLLGDRLRMNAHYNNERVYIRSLSSRGALGVISAKTIEVLDVMKAAGFDWIFVETVGVGQNEIEIAGVAELTLVVLVPEAGDEIQALKSGIMEAGDVFAVNKSDRDGAILFTETLKSLVHAPVVQVVATQSKGIDALVATLANPTKAMKSQNARQLLAAKALRLVQHRRVKGIELSSIANALEEAEASAQGPFNIYQFVETYMKTHGL